MGTEHLPSGSGPCGGRLADNKEEIMKLSQLQREVLAAVGRGEVYRMERPPYTATMKGRPRAVSSSIDALFGHGLIQMGRRNGFVRYFELNDEGREVLGRLEAKS